MTSTGADELIWLRELLAGDATAQLPPPPSDVHRRLRDAVAGLEPGMSGGRDVAALVRQCLRREARISRSSPVVRVRRLDPWPTTEDWESCGCSATPDGPHSFRIRAETWRPTWLVTGSEGFDDVSVAAGLPLALRRHDSSLAGDPFFGELLGDRYDRYQTPGQRQAVRAAVTLPANGTLIVNLPTGSGKTEVALVVALAKPALRGVTLVVVPTVSLAQDLERRIQAILRTTGREELPIAYIGETPSDVKGRMVRGVRAGTQPVIVTSPEAAAQPLRQPLLEAAASGHVRCFVIDEAHLVRQWGTSFRPEFQALAGLRDRMLEAAGSRGFRTLLLSATLGDADVELLVRLFGAPGPMDLVAANALRPEPEYWSVCSPDEVTREARTVEALLHLPKPAILYVTRPIDADRWCTRLRLGGLRRVAVVTGPTAADERAAVLGGLRGDEGATAYDVVVANSAFGLGISYDAVRTVIHACLPETIDRYYQEVGRSGRDGYASVSLVSWTPRDRFVQHAIASTTVIGWEKARARWDAMRVQADRLQDGGYVVDLDVYPAYLRESSDLNVAWNLATLSLMGRAGMVDLIAPTVERQLPNEGDSEAGIAQEKSRGWTRSVAVKVRAGDLRSDTAWQQSWKELRVRIEQQDAEQLAAMEGALRQGVRLCNLLSSMYVAMSDHGLGSSVSFLQPVLACGRCQTCRGDVLTIPVTPEPPASRHAAGQVSARLLQVVGDAATFTVVYEPSRTDHPGVAKRFVAAAIAHGIQSFLVPEAWRRLPEFHAESFGSPFGSVFVSEPAAEPIHLPPVPTGVLVPPDGSGLRPVWYVPQHQRPVVILAPTTALHPNNPQWTLRDVPPSDDGAWMDVDDFLGGVA